MAHIQQRQSFNCNRKSASVHVSQPRWSRVQDKYDTFTFEEEEDSEVLVKKFEDICLPVKNIIMDRHAFNTMNQKPHETIQSYVAMLKPLARKCEFATLHEELIRDRLVCGIHIDNIRTQLLKYIYIFFYFKLSYQNMHAIWAVWKRKQRNKKRYSYQSSNML